MADQFPDPTVQRDRRVHVRYTARPGEPMLGSNFLLQNCLGDDASVAAAIQALIGSSGTVISWTP